NSALRRSRTILSTRIRHSKRTMILAVHISSGDEIRALRSLMIALSFFGADRRCAKSDPVGLHHSPIAEQFHLALRFQNDDVVYFCSRGHLRRQMYWRNYRSEENRDGQKFPAYSHTDCELPEQNTKFRHPCKLSFRFSATGTHVAPSSHSVPPLTLSKCSQSRRQATSCATRSFAWGPP